MADRIQSMCVCWCTIGTMPSACTRAFPATFLQPLAVHLSGEDLYIYIYISSFRMKSSRCQCFQEAVITAHCVKEESDCRAQRTPCHRTQRCHYREQGLYEARSPWSTSNTHLVI